MKMTVHEQAPALQIAALLNRHDEHQPEPQHSHRGRLEQRTRVDGRGRGGHAESPSARPAQAHRARRPCVGGPHRPAAGELPVCALHTEMLHRRRLPAAGLPASRRCAVGAQPDRGGFRRCRWFRNRSPVSRPTRSCSDPSGPRRRPPTCFSSSERTRRRWWCKTSSSWRVVSSGRSGIRITSSPADDKVDGNSASTR